MRLTSYRGYGITTNMNPYSRDNYEFIHDDFDGAPDSKDMRYGTGKTVADCMSQIDEQIAEDQDNGE